MRPNQDGGAVAAPIVIEHAHSILGPSVSDQWIHCPASILAGKDLPSRATKYSAEGTFYHEVSLWVREQKVPATKFIGYEGIVDGFSFRVTKTGAYAIQRFVDWCEAVPGDPFYEIRVAYDEYVPGGFGTADDIRLQDYVACLTDLKFGTGHKVYARNNSQLMLYALGVYLKYRWAYVFADFELRIAQPRLDHWDTWRITLQELLQWAGDVAAPAARRALSPGAPFRAGPWCQFCKLRDTCSVRAEYRQQKEAMSRANDFALIGNLT
jgi:hypothetical protein